MTVGRPLIDEHPNIVQARQSMATVNDSAALVRQQQAVCASAQMALTQFQNSHEPSLIYDNDLLFGEQQRKKLSVARAKEALALAQTNHNRQMELLQARIPTLEGEERLQRVDLENRTQKIRALNPAALGEDRFNRSLHWRITNLCLAIFYFFYDRYYVNDLCRDLQGRVDAQYALQVTLKELQLLQEFITTMPKIAKEEPAPMERPRPTPTIDPFSKLTISEGQKRQLHYLLPLVANSNTADLVWNIKALSAARRDLEPLHPLKSLEVIVKELKAHLVTIKNTPDKWNGRQFPFYGSVGGFCPSTAEKLQRYHAQGSILPCLPGFAKSVGLTEAQETRLTTLAQQGQWQQFVSEIAAL